MNMLFRTFVGRVAAALLVAAAAAAAPARAGLVVLGPGEVDIVIGFDDGRFEVTLVDEENEVEYAPNEALLFVGATARTNQPADPRFGFIGAGAGNPVWIIPQNLNPAVLYLGIEPEIDPGTFATYFETDPRVNATGEWIRVGFTAVRGPGEFSAWQTDAFGRLTVWASTFQGGLTAADAFFTFSGAGDVHLNYGFTAVGLYEVDVVVSAFQGSELEPVRSGVVTLRFGVETAGAAVVPEPAAGGLLALGGVLALWRGRRAGAGRRTFGRRGLGLERLEDRAVLTCGCGGTDLLTGHVDGIALDYINGTWAASVWDQDNDVRYSPGDANLVAVPAARTARPTGSQWDFLGTTAGSDVWILPQTQNPDLLYLGANSERTTSGSLASYFDPDPRVGGTAPWIRVAVTDVRGPGRFSMWQTGFFGGTTVWVSTADGLTADDAFYLAEGAHTHFNWGFTARGYYEVDVRATAYLGPGQTNPTTSDVFTYRFSVEPPGCFQFDSPTYSVSEAGTLATVTVTRTSGSYGTVTVDYATGDGTAAAGSDYAAAAGTLTFLPGQTSQTFTVLITDDAQAEPNETINLALSNPTGGARVGCQSTAVLTILDDDGGGVQAVTADDADPNFTASGAWTPGYTESGHGDFGGGVTWAAPGAAASAYWQFTVAPGVYRVLVGFNGYSWAATNTPFEVWDGGDLLATVRVDQTVTPTDLAAGGIGYKSLGDFTVTGTTLWVGLTNDADGYVFADAVRLERVG